MPEYKVRLEVWRDDSKPETVEETMQSRYEAPPDVLHGFARDVAAEFSKAIRYREYLAEIPDSPVKLVETRSHHFNFAKPVSEFHDSINTQSLWLEIRNNLGDVRFLLAQARAYKSLEPSQDKTDYDSDGLRYYAHFAKMHRLNLAVFGLVKIQDLVVRLLFENLGGTKLIPVKETDVNWEKKLTLEAAKKGLKSQLDSGSLAKEDFDAIVKATDHPSQSEHQSTLIAYRHGVIHRLRPSVDYPQLFTPIENRVGEPLLDESGKERGRKYSFWGLPDKPAFYFADLYAALLSHLKFVIEMLTMLKSIQRLA